MPTGNKEGSWYYLILKTWRVIKRNRSETLPMPDEFLDIKANEAGQRDARSGKLPQMKI